MTAAMSTIEEDISFINSFLIPEMVHDRCFCDAGSREFVELESAEVEVAPAKKLHGREHIDFRSYRGKVVISFSGEPRTFAVLVKLLPDAENPGPAFDAFLNEEMLYNKMALHYGYDLFPKCYVADLGKYGRPIVVLEDLEENGYRTLNRRLNEDELKMALATIGRFHARGFKLKETKFQAFREFYAKFVDTTFEEVSKPRLQKRLFRWALSNFSRTKC